MFGYELTGEGRLIMSSITLFVTASCIASVVAFTLLDSLKHRRWAATLGVAAGVLSVVAITMSWSLDIRFTRILMELVGVFVCVGWAVSHWLNKGAKSSAE